MRVIVQNTYIAGKPQFIARVRRANGTGTGYYADSPEAALQRLHDKEPDTVGVEAQMDIHRIPYKLTSRTIGYGRDRREEWVTERP